MSSERVSVLESAYVKQQRPYSENELKYLRENLYKKINIGTIKAYHSKCQHFYFVKNNSRKEKEIKEKNNSENVGNCSVCWKINKTEKRLKNNAYDLVDSYCNGFYNNPENYNYNLLDLENGFYTWLYLENNERNERTERTERNGKNELNLTE